MTFQRSKFVLLTSLSLCAYVAHSGKPLFNVTFIKDKQEPTGYITVRSNTNNQTYSNAGILLTYPNYKLSGTNECTMNPANGWCLFSVSNKTPKTFKVTQLFGSSPLSTPPQNKINVKIALNAQDKTPISIQQFSSEAQTPGRMIGYLYGWQTPPAASEIAAAGYTHVLIAFGLLSTSTPGDINLQSISGFNLTTYIQSLHQNGLKVLLSMGGASTNIANTTVDFGSAVSQAANPSTFVNTLVNTMVSLVNTYGFDGFDFDIEHGINGASPSSGCSNNTYSASCTISYLSNIINTFHMQYPNSMLTMAPQIANIAATSGFDATWGNYASLIMQTYASLEWVGFQNYNAGCAYGINLVCYPTNNNTLTSTADAAVAFSTDLLANWPATTASGQATGFQPYISYLTPSQVVIGYVVNNAAGQSDGAPAAITAITKKAVQCLRSGEQCDSYTPPATYPGIGGVFSWTINYDANNDYQFAKSLYPCVVKGNCT